ncbi:MAG: hypothetical protein Q4G19_05300 [Clostridia bacterium]|nr:hypothetical protein [Clostridia bacterium]
MRKRLLALIMTVLLAAGFSLPASAISDLKFSETCKSKTSRAVTLYVWNKEEQKLYESITLSAGAYLRNLGSDDVTAANSGMAHIVCSPYDNDDDLRYGYIESSAIRSATRTVTLESGRTVSVPEALTKSRSRLEYYLELEYQEKAASDKVTDEDGKESEIGEDDDDGGSSDPSGDAAWAAGVAKAQKANGYSTPTVWTDENGTEHAADVIGLGVAVSQIRVAGEKMTVPTSELSWETTAPDNKVIAVVKNNKSGYTKLRAKKNKKSLIMDRCAPTSVVRVIATGNTWTKVDYNGLRGYVLTSALTFFDNAPKEYKTGVISFRGRTSGSKNTINVRAGAKNTSRILADYPVGTPVAIFETSGKWTCIDVDGFHCWILTEYLTEDPAQDEAGPAE